MLPQSTGKPARILVGNRWVDGVLLSVTKKIEAQLAMHVPSIGWVTDQFFGG